MKKNDIVEIQIEDLSHEGAGIGHVDGITCFVKDAVPGDLVHAIITKVKKTYCFATVKEVINPSAFRVEPLCPEYRKCGGCQIMQLSYEKQLQIKQSIVENNLIRIGGFDKEFVKDIMEPILGMETPFRYRNKAQVPVAESADGEIVAGFYGARSHRVVPNSDCKLCSEQSMKIVSSITDFMKNNSIKAYDENSGQGVLRHVLIREGKASGETMVCLVVNGESFPKQELLVEKLIHEFDSIKSIVLNTNTRRDNVILGNVTTPIWGKESIRDSITLDSGDTVYFDISANSFYQVNHDQMEKLYSIALEYANLSGNESVWDLYCGIGTITLSMAKRAKVVYGVEIVPQAIENAKANAELNGINNTEFFLGEAEVVLPEFYEKNAGQQMACPDVIVVDPPRKGCDEACLGTMVKMQPQRIVYVSCDTATLARDLKYLCENGYRLEKVRPVDQFGHTMHTECVACLKRK